MKINPQADVGMESQRTSSLPTMSDSPIPVLTPGSPTSVSTTLGGEIMGSLSDDEWNERKVRKRPRSLMNSKKPRPGFARLVSEEFSCRDENNKAQSLQCISSGGEEDDESTGCASGVDRHQYDLCASDCEEIDDVSHTLETSREKLYSSSAFLRRVSDLGSEVISEDRESSLSSEEAKDVHHFPNPLHLSALLPVHLRSLRLESELQPMRLVVSRLMSHPTHNRRGIFNVPVDPVALGLPDYHIIVTNPMDLGTVKARLHAVVYTRRDEIANDIRLVFQNAMRYNPQDNLVHIAARNLLDVFEEAYEEIQKKSGVSVHASTPSPLVDAGTNDTAVNLLNGSATHALNGSHDVNQVPSSPVHNLKLDGASTSAAQLPTKAGWVTPAGHSCDSCLGRICAMCAEGCLTHEPALLICTGPNCAGAKIRKGGTYYISTDGSRQYCQRCYSSLSAVLPQSDDQAEAHGTPVRYKRELLKRKNEEEVMEQWLTCTKCSHGVHKVCAMYNEFVHSEEDFVCPTCVSGLGTRRQKPDDMHRIPSEQASREDDMFTFVSGSDDVIKVADLVGHDSPDYGILNADSLPECEVSSFIQQKIRERMVNSGYRNAERTVTVRMISDCSKYFNVPDVIRKHFRMRTGCSEAHPEARVAPPARVHYNSKAIALFQKIDGLDVCIFCMYVQEYDGNDEYDVDGDADTVRAAKRVYIAYLDSVEHFRPRSCRTQVYHEMLVAYLATARARGYETAYIWACPPSRGNSFVFWNHPHSQRTPTKDRLVSWYHGALSRAIDCGVVTNVKSLYESAFEPMMPTTDDERQGDAVVQPNPSGSAKMICPPLLDGDFWIEEAVRIHSASIARYLKSKTGSKETASLMSNTSDLSDGSDVCPAVQVASVIRNRIMAHKSCEPFRRPVNAAAMNLTDYHRIISKPMDLGTVYSRCILGEFDTLQDLVTDVRLVFTNAMRFNPKGHFVHEKAIEVQELFFDELNLLTKTWGQPDLISMEGEASWMRYASISLSLDATLDKVVHSNGDLSSHSQSSHENSAALSEHDMVYSANKEDVSTLNMDAGCQMVQSQQGSQKLERNAGTKKPKLIRKLDLLSGGPDAVLQRMVGDDVWLMDKRNPVPPKGFGSTKKKSSGKRKQTGTDDLDEVSSKRRRQSWLGEEIGTSMRRMRTSFFSCSLLPNSVLSGPEEAKILEYNSYAKSFMRRKQDEMHRSAKSSRIADARHVLLEFSQYRNFEFDTLRRAKYSTAMLLYHLHHDDAPGVVPDCSSCGEHIQYVRWHKVRKAGERRHRGHVPLVNRIGSQNIASSSDAVPLTTDLESDLHMELCSSCHTKELNGEDYIPLPVSFKP